MARRYIYGTPEERFWEKVDRSGDCWLWTAAIGRDGYGVFGWSAQRKALKAHRASVELQTGRPVPKGKIVMHLCDVRACVRPSHLQVGTQTDNMRHMVEANRHSGKLNQDKASLLRWLVRNGVTQAGAARLMGISATQASRVVREEVWC